MIPSLGLSALNQTLFSTVSAPKTPAGLQTASSGDLVHLSDEALQLQEANGLFALDPGRPSDINSSNALEAIDALLLGFTPTHSTINLLG